MQNTPEVSDFITSPLRNRIRVELNAPVSKVWELMGDLSRFPEYSVGLERVDVKKDANGMCTEYTCHFKPHEEGAEGVVSRDIMRWYEPNRGYLSQEMGGTNTVALMTLEPTQTGTLMNYEIYFDTEDLDATRAALDAALVDIGKNLIKRFGGKIIEQYIEQ